MEEEVIKRIMPHSNEAEQAVIGSMLMDADAISIALETVSADDFYGRQYALMFEAMRQLYNEGKPIDILTLQTRLLENGAPPEIGSLDFLREIYASVPTSVNVKAYGEIVKEKSVLRSIIRMNDEITNQCYAGTDSAENITEQLEKNTIKMIQSRVGGDYVPIRQVVVNVIDRIEAAAKNNGSVTGVPTGFLDLDYKTSGLQPSDLILIAARPSMGKTAFTLNLLEYMAIKKNVGVAMFSLEMSKEQLVNRLFAQEAKVDAQLLRNGNLQESDWEKIVESANIIGNANIIIDDTPGISISELRSKCRRYKMEKNIGIIMIDYLQLMTGGGKSESRQQEISEISRSLKALARELSVPVVALSQLSRAVESRPDHRPMLSDLRESGAIEQDADVVMFLYRDDYYHPDTEEKNIAEVIIAKQRNGPIGTVKLAWLPNFTKFANLQK